MKTVKVQFHVKDPDTCQFIVHNATAAGKLFEFGEYATIELEIDCETKGAPIVAARFVGKKKK